jgi:hypothetical protein
MVPCIEPWILQWIAKLPAVGTVRLAVPLAGTSTSNEPSSAVTVWATLSLLVIVNGVPAVTDAAENELPEIVIPPPAAAAVDPAAPVAVVPTGAPLGVLLDLLSLLQAVAVNASMHAPATARRTLV